MNKILKLFAFISIIAFFFINACKTDNNEPNNNDVRSKYVATWTCNEQGGMSYPVVITLDSSNSAQILIGNFHFLGSGTKAKAIATATSLTLPSQDLCGYTFTGGGTLVNSNKINMLYYANNHSTIDTVNATYSK